MIDILFGPFNDYMFMRRALVASLGIAMSSVPIGVFLMLRRMSLLGDALAHGILPGIAIAGLLFGLSPLVLGLGGMVAGLIVAILSSWMSRSTILHEDASFTGFYLTSLAAGVAIISMQGHTNHLMHLLFGNILAIDDLSLILIAIVTSFSVITISLIYRPLVYESFDPVFIETVGLKRFWFHYMLMVLVVINLVTACQALGTMLALGIMLLPAVTARLWCYRLVTLFSFALSQAILTTYGGLVLAFYFNWPAAPLIILLNGAAYMASLVISSFRRA